MRVGPGQRRLHMVSEGIALLVLAPWLVGISFLLPAPHATIALVVAGGTVLIDGGLLATWWRGRVHPLVAAAENAWARRRVMI